MSARLPIDVGREGLLWFGVSGALLVGLLYLADVDAFFDSLARAETSLFAVAVAVGVSSLMVWAWVWHRVFATVGIEATRSQTVRMFLTGNFLNSITPLGQFGGEPIMAYVVSDTTGEDYETTLACVVSADILNAIPFFTFTVGGIIYLGIVGSVQGPLVDIGVLAVVLLIGVGLIAYLLWSDDSTLGNALFRLLDAIEARLGRAEALFESARESLRQLEETFQEAGSDPRYLLTTVAISHLAILAQIASLYFVFGSIGLQSEFVPIYLIVNLSVIGTLSPTPGGTGTYEAIFSGLVTWFYSVELATALTAAVLFRLTTYWPGLLIGWVALLTLQNGAKSTNES